MKVEQILAQESERYPWTHRIGFDDNSVRDFDHIKQWIDEQNVKGLWVHKAFYTNGKNVTILILKWGHL